MTTRIIVLLLGMIFSPALFAGTIAGFWKVEDHPAWIEVTVNDGVASGVVARNDAYPERQGRLLLKDLKPVSGKAGAWVGQVYAERFEEYRKANISVNGDALDIKVKVGFMSRTISWIRAAGIPESD